MKIKDFIDYEQPNEYIVESDRYSSKYSTPVLTAGQSFILGYTNESKGIYKKGPCIIFDDFTTSVHYVDFPFKVKSSAMKILTTKSIADLKYCYYLLLSLSKMPPNHKRQWISTTSEKNHLLPSIDKQISIVKQLDLISDTIAYYTNQIENLDNLVKARFIEMFGDPVINSMGWSEALIGDNCFVTKLAGFEYTQYINYKDSGDVVMVKAQNVKNGKLNRKELSFISKEISDSLPRSQLEPGDIVMTYVGANIGDVAVIDNEYKYHLAPNVAKIRPNAEVYDSIYFAYMLMLLNSYIVKNSADTAKAALGMDRIRKLHVFVPPIDIQRNFSEFIKQVDKSKLAVQKSLEKTQQLFDSLMQEYFG